MSSISYSDFVEIRSAIRTTAVGASMMMPVGGICMFPSATPPVGYLLCDGATITIEDYPNLYTIIGDTFSAGQPPPAVGSFYVPDMRGRFVVGNGQNAGDAVYNINDKGGEQTHVLATNEVGQHTHGIVLTDAGHTHTATATSAEHTHNLTDGGHNHGITDTGHTHAITDPGHTHGNGPNTTGGLTIVGAPAAGNGGSSSSATTGITIDSHVTDITINNGSANIGIDSASVDVSVTIASAVTTLSAVVGTTDVAVGHENRPPFIALAYIIRAI
jgi:microcystin-dependent protein